MIDTLSWNANTWSLTIIDQRKLPSKLEYLNIKTAAELWTAIKNLAIRGAPAIGVAAAYGIVMEVYRSKDRSIEKLIRLVNTTADYLITCRPTAVNLKWAAERMRRIAQLFDAKEKDFTGTILQEAHAIFNEDLELSRSIGAHGTALVHNNARILTHCNAGGLATAGLGTALSIVYASHAAGKNISVFSCETRPLLQGARLTCYELLNHGVKTTLVCDNMAGHLMQSGCVDIVITGADRIAGNGDTANKIGTYGLAVLAAHHGIPFYIAAPYSTIDINTPNGASITLEVRGQDEIKYFMGFEICPPETKVYNPAFDVTPASLITAIITEKGVLRPPYETTISKAYI